MDNVKRILDFYIRRNLRLKARGESPISIRDSALRDRDFREDKVKIPKSKEEAKKRSVESVASEEKSKTEDADRIKKMVDSGNAEWRTINGAHVCIDKGGGIVAGPNHMVGKIISDFESPKSSVHDVEIPKVTKSAEELKSEREKRARLSLKTVRDRQQNMDISPKGENQSCGGFREAEGFTLLSDHFDSHGKEPPFAKMTPDEYEKFAEQFLMQPCSDNILGGAVEESHDGIKLVAIIRYDKTTGIFAKGYPGGYVKTCMVAKYTSDTPNGKVYNPNWKRDGYDYFLREMQKATWKPKERK